MIALCIFESFSAPAQPAAAADPLADLIKAAQAEADRQALLDKGRKILRIHWKKDAAGGIRTLAGSL